MAAAAPTALILGHSFVKRLKRDLHSGFDRRAARDFRLHGTASVCLHGIGGRTVHSLRAYDLHVVRDLAPDVIILEIGTNDLSHAPPEVVGSAIEDLVSLLLNEYSVRVMGVCHVIPRGIASPQALSFLQQSTVLNQYVSVVLEQFTNVFCWSFLFPFAESCQKQDHAHHGSVKLGQRLDHPGHVLVPGPVSGQVLQHQQELQDDRRMSRYPTWHRFSTGFVLSSAKYGFKPVC